MLALRFGLAKWMEGGLMSATSDTDVSQIRKIDTHNGGDVPCIRSSVLHGVASRLTSTVSKHVDYDIRDVV